ncbi:hypothetical protein B9Z55_017125 [Caenorhabditis nigoni]|uniref:Delta-like protein n=2 Tax=Caenorhabditis nigoni TaxID=1611254 RepID=A0A2G5T8A1_9PELO|nr:hypothetical protein B9Z55_017125 [Caenorhabditis nigoni]
MRCLLLLTLLPQLISGKVEVSQTFISSERVSMRFEIVTNDGNSTRNFNLFPGASRTSMIHQNVFDTAFNYSIQLFQPFTKQPLSDRIYRQVHFTSINQPWFNDTFTTGSGIVLSISTKIGCSPNYHGSQCEAFCDAHLAKAARKRCDVMGRLRCDIGWMGPHCGQAVDPRKCSCQNNGVCASSLIHNPELKANSTEQLICECANGYTGSRCEIPGFTQFQFTAPRPDACSVKDACLNGAQCFPNGPKVFCACSVGFIGEFCEISLTTTSTPSIEITATTSDYSMTIYSIVGIFIGVCIIIGCCKYKWTARREHALARGLVPEPYPMPEAKSMLLVDPKKVFTIEDSVKKVDEEEIRYTSAPRNNEYAVIQKQPPPPVPSVPVPSVPVTYSAYV